MRKLQASPRGIPRAVTAGVCPGPLLSAQAAACKTAARVAQREFSPPRPIGTRGIKPSDSQAAVVQAGRQTASRDMAGPKFRPTVQAYLFPEGQVTNALRIAGCARRGLDVTLTVVLGIIAGAASQGT